MTGTKDALGRSAAVDDAARSVTRPFYVYAVLANTLFQRGVFVLFLQQRGFSAGQVALLQTLLHLVSGLAELPTGVIADRIGRRAGIVIGQVLVAGCLLGQVAFSNYWVFLALFIGQGVGMACMSGSDTALLYDPLVRRGATADYVRSSPGSPRSGRSPRESPSPSAANCGNFPGGSSTAVRRPASSWPWWC
ncbi:MFS transporter [Streptomyces sp. SID4985]|uniref:MFS transporter n=1 Tax=Streptomyces sp. SID4985 TaxID=2690292 RepID=UPI001F0031B6|nr:MFS transporter [Streptomyces sp. SID4985]